MTLELKSLFKVEKLNNTNYHAWEFKMRFVLERDNTLKFITDDPPRDLVDGNPNPALVAWNEGSRQALQLIVMSVEDSQLILLRGIVSGRRAWEVLKNHHRNSTLGGTNRIMTRLFSKRLDTNESMRDHLNLMLQWIDELQEAGTALTNDVKIGMLLSSVNHEYGNIVTALEAWEPDRITIDAIKVKLVDEWEKRQTEVQAGLSNYHNPRRVDYNQRFSQQSSSPDGPYRGGSNQPSTSRAAQQNSSANREGFLCHFCRKPGHFRKDCPDLRKWLNQKRLANCKEDDNKDSASAKLARTLKWYFAFFNSNDLRQSSSWFIDSGATKHMSWNKNIFSEIDTSRKEWIVVGNGERVKSEGIGKLKLFVSTSDGPLEVELQEVLWAPKLDVNLISVACLAKGKRSVEFTDGMCYFKDGTDRVKIAVSKQGLYTLLETPRVFSATTENELNETRCIHDWHKRFAHRNLADIKLMKQQVLLIKDCDHPDECEACIKGKMSRRSFPKVSTPTRNSLDCVVSDVCGPMQVESLGKKKYFVTFVDLYSGYTEVFGIRSKSDVTSTTKEYIEALKTQLGRKPKTFRSDRGMEYLNSELQDYLRKEGIKVQCTVGYAPEQNGAAERKNRTLVEAARTMLADSGLPKTFWAEALSTANFVFNRIINKKHLKSPFELFYGEKPTKTHFHEFGCDVYTKIPSPKLRKLDEKAVKMKFIGYDSMAKGYRLADDNYKIHISREVKFLNSRSCDDVADDNNQLDLYLEKSNEPGEEFFDAESDDEDDSNDVNNSDTDSSDSTDYTTQSSYESDEVFEENNQSTIKEEPERLTTPVVQLPVSAKPSVAALPRRTLRSTVGKTSRYNDYVSYSADTNRGEPKTFLQASKSIDSNSWMDAMKSELKAIDDNQTWELTTLPPGRKAIGSRWVFKAKKDETGAVTKFKARLVAQGFSQKFGIDYDQVFAPVARSATLRLVLSVAGNRNYIVHHFDITTAFLNGVLNEEIFMKQPPGFESGEKVYKLKKSLYGLKQSARVWNETLHEALVSNGCKQNPTDKCLYVKKVNFDVCYILIHVDDILVATNKASFMNDLMKNVSRNFDIKNLGGVKTYLGIDIERDNGKFVISQSSYIDSIIEEAKLADGKISKFPLDTGYYKQEGELLPSSDEYRKLIGMLLYLTTNSRPDIAASVGILSQRVEKPRDTDLVEVKRIIRYLKGTRNLKLRLNGDNCGPENSFILNKRFF